MTFPRFWSMVEFWREHPPLHLMVEAFVLGVGGRNKRGKYEPARGPREQVPEFTASEFNELSSLLGGCDVRSKPVSI